MNRNCADELRHYGVKGMKWGVIRKRPKGKEGRALAKEYRKDRKEQNRYARQVSVTKKDLVKTQTEKANAKSSYKTASDNEAKLRSKLFRNEKKISEASEATGRARTAYESATLNANRAGREYGIAAKKLKKQTEKMIAKYGEANVQQIRKEKIPISVERTLNVISTGVTLGQISSRYGDRYRSTRESERAKDRANKNVREMIKKEYGMA